MNTVTVSRRFQVVIPKALREKLGIQPGQKLAVLANENRIELILVRPAKEMRGFVRGMATDVLCEADRI